MHFILLLPSPRGCTKNNIGMSFCEVKVLNFHMFQIDEVASLRTMLNSTYLDSVMYMSSTHMDIAIIKYSI